MESDWIKETHISFGSHVGEPRTENQTEAFELTKVKSGSLSDGSSHSRRVRVTNREVTALKRVSL